MLHFQSAANQIAIARLDGERELRIGLGIFVAAVDRGHALQGAELVDRLIHLRRRAFEDAATAQRKQRIGGKQEIVIGEVIGHMAEGVAGAGEDLHRAVGQLQDVAALHRLRNAGDLVLLGLGSDDAAAEDVLQFEVARDVILVVMRGEDVGELPAALLQLVRDGGCIRCIN